MEDRTAHQIITDFTKKHTAAIAVSIITALITAIGGWALNGFRYLYWLSYFKRFKVPSSFYTQAIIPDVDKLYVFVLLVLVIGIVLWSILNSLSEWIQRLFLKFCIPEPLTKKGAIACEITFLFFFSFLYAIGIGLCNDWLGYGLLFSELVFLIGTYWHSCLGKKILSSGWSIKAKNQLYSILFVVVILMLLYLLYLYGGDVNCLSSNNGGWANYVVQDESIEPVLNPGDNIKVVLFETEKYYYTIDGDYWKLINSGNIQIKVVDLRYTLLEKQSTKVESIYIDSLFAFLAESGWEPPTLAQYEWFSFQVYVYVLVSSLIVGWPTKKKDTQSV